MGSRLQCRAVRAILICLAVSSLLGCPPPSAPDGGTGGGTSSTGGGTATAGGSGGGSGGTGGGTSGGTGGSAGGGTASGLPISQLCTRLIDARCDVGVRCGTFHDKAACVRILSLGSGCPMTSLAGVDAGRVAYDGDDALTCLA